MRFLYFFIYLFPALFFAQQKPLSVTIKTIATDNSDPKERRYQIAYEIANTTDKLLTFYFSPGGFGGSLSNKLYYKIYQNEEFLDNGTILNEKTSNSKFFEEKTDPKISEEERNTFLKKFFREEYDMDIDSLKAISPSEEKTMFTTNKMQQKLLRKERFTLAPKEVKKFTEIVYWNKERYVFKEPHEYYIEENGKHS